MANILILDHERTVRNLLALLLRRNHHHVRQARSIKEASRIADEQVIDLILADVKVTDGTRGVEFALHALRVQPRIRVLFISSLPPSAWDDKNQANLLRMPQGSYLFLRKPLSFPTLNDAIAHLLAGYNYREVGDL